MVVVVFTVQAPMPPRYISCLVGDAPELGSWDPLQALTMARVKKTDTWRIKVDLKKGKVYQFRYFSCKPMWKSYKQSKSSLQEISHGHRTDLRQAEGIAILYWESGIPRTVDTSTLPDYHELDLVMFGVRRTVPSEWSRGWLTTISDVRIRICGANPIRLNADPEAQGQRFRIKCQSIVYDELLTKKSSIASTSSGPETVDPMASFITASNLPVSAYMRTIKSSSNAHLKPPSVTSHMGSHSSVESAMTNTSISSAGILPSQLLASMNEDEMKSKTDLIMPVSHEVDEFSVFQKDSFLTFMAQIRHIEVLGFKLEIVPLGEAETEGEPMFAYLLPLTDADTENKNFPVFNRRGEAIGELTINYLVTNPTPGLHLDMKISYQNHWVLESGLLAFGTATPRDCFSSEALGRATFDSVSCNTIASVRENTVASIKTAHLLGASFAEIHVQLCAEEIPVIFADFYALISHQKRSSQAADLYSVAIKDMSLDQLHATKLKNISDAVSNTSVMSGATITERDMDPFPTLEKCLDELDLELGIDIQVMYPQVLYEGRHEMPNYWGKNQVCDIILQTVFRAHRGRRIVFSSFHPDICIMLSRKQNRFPVLFMSHGSYTSGPVYEDTRTQTAILSMYFAHSEHLLGVGLKAHEIIKHPENIKRAQKLGLILAAWSSVADGKQHDILRRQKVDMIVTDDLDLISPPVFEVKRTRSCMNLNVSEFLGPHLSKESIASTRTGSSGPTRRPGG